MQNIETTTIGNCDYIVPVKGDLGRSSSLYGYQCLTKKEYNDFLEENKPTPTDRFFFGMIAGVLVFVGVIWILCLLGRFFLKFAEDFKK